MSKFNKQHKYKGYTFNIEVILNFRIEKCIGGKREHIIRINDIGPSKYYQNHLAETHHLEEIIELMILEAEKWVDHQINGGKSIEEVLLLGLGFK